MSQLIKALKGAVLLPQYLDELEGKNTHELLDLLVKYEGSSFYKLARKFHLPIPANYLARVSAIRATLEIPAILNQGPAVRKMREYPRNC